MSYGIGLTARMQQALKAGLPLYLLGILDHPDGEVRLWTGTGDLVWEGQTFTGRGQLASIGQTDDSMDLVIHDRVLRLAGVSPESISLLTDDVRNRVATVYIAAVDRHRRVVPEPYLLDEILMDSQAYPIDAQGNAMIQITGFSGLWTLERAQSIAWTTEQAKLTYPDETGFDQIPILVNRDTKWKKS